MKIIIKIKNAVRNEFIGFRRAEILTFLTVIFIVAFLSFLMNDSKIALISAICGISYTILAGYGRVSCYFIGILGTFCYCYIAYKNGFWGNLTLYGLYYLPMEILGIFKWQKHFKKDRQEIIKTKLTAKERALYFGTTFVLAVAASCVLFVCGGKTPFMDGFATVFSILGQLLTLKRCIEQWYVWFLVNLISFIMWIFAYINGSNCLATIIMWGIYIILSIYFLTLWKKELNTETSSKVKG